MTIRKKIILAAAVGAATCAAGCQEDRRDSENVVTVTQAYTASADLIIQGPGRCTLRGSRLASCSIPTQVLTGQDLETAVPLRTVITTNVIGNCTAQYPLEVTLETPGEPAVKLAYLTQRSATVRRRDGMQIAVITLKDSSPWTSLVTLDPSCRISVDIVSNEPDVDTKEQAQAIIDKWTASVADKTRIRDRYSDLLNYQKAFTFLSTFVTYFHTELTNDRMQKLRDDGQAARSVIMKMVSADACSGALSDDEFVAIVALYESLAVLGSSSSWTNADGGTKTIADFLQGDGPKVLAVAQRLSRQHSSDSGTGYEAEYRQAARELEQVQAKLTLAKVQLTRWRLP